MTTWNCGGYPGSKRNGKDVACTSKEQRRIAIESFIRFDYSYADTIAELGYPIGIPKGAGGTPIQWRCPL